MSLTYTFSLKKLKKENTDQLNNVVTQIYWTKTATDENGNSATIPGGTPFNISSADPDNFTSYENLNDEIILSWIPNSNDDEIFRTIIKEQLNPEINSSNFPWNVGVATT
tara:strand:- start:172 stop:501 length:330 start_codon:yes stop_codon:yes gene_type:complete